MSTITNLSVPRDRITSALEHSPNYFRPIMRVVRDAGVQLCIVGQDAAGFAVPKGRPAILMIGDDMWTSKGPDAFHKPSLDNFVRRCRSAVIVACEPVFVAYAAAATVAAAGLNVVIVETRPEHEADWKAALDAIKPDLSFVLATVEPAGGMH